MIHRVQLVGERDPPQQVRVRHLEEAEGRADLLGIAQPLIDERPGWEIFPRL